MRRGFLLDASPPLRACPSVDSRGRPSDAAANAPPKVPFIDDQALDLPIRLRVPLLLHQLSLVPSFGRPEQAWMALGARV